MQKCVPEIEVASVAAVRFVSFVSRARSLHHGQGRQRQEGASTLQEQGGGEVDYAGQSTLGGTAYYCLEIEIEIEMEIG